MYKLLPDPISLPARADNKREKGRPCETNYTHGQSPSVIASVQEVALFGQFLEPDYKNRIFGKGRHEASAVKLK